MAGRGGSAGYAGVAVFVRTGGVCVPNLDLSMSGLMGCVCGWVVNILDLDLDMSG